ncbi:hydroxyacid-oxoacid transhydrogenase [Mycobacterium haemophilum]|uniref:hydroxyacid-oxoacid transhydrogenase n=1 Tax=Mycobacterium haemophilum TaxID=29311 RepID=A0A0I9XZB2_9MYCO|nr:hydroxyacid-oxoacid transhydrogenase [Mycobacterium haemophilum]KLO32547.1 alcohol dehydrogenase [Mycobacterium haemophilum]KLO36807.1 alcohol dehydrogenase [Mycobacterium haemophilum]KLO42827.1 alcohol dehydrogenase [Mycobacterium haemophilum]KLO55799.1 alcohol dehydrogenase [Mycobacterium haemophilum]
MACCDFPTAAKGCDGAFTIDASRVTFGRGCLAEVGARASALGLRRVALFSDADVAKLSIFEKTRASLLAAGLAVITYTDVHVEPTDMSFLDGARFAQELNPDGYVSLGGGSVIDTCKAANLYATYPAELLTYVNAPVGEGKPVPGPLKPHIACPTTAGTGSEVTGITIFDLLSLSAKTGIASPALRPTEALVDPDCTASLPPEVVAAAGLDVLSHALESYTARPYVRRLAPERPNLRPMSQGANPWSDLGCRAALRLLGQYLERAVQDSADSEAREQMMWAATLAGIAFGNAGVHAPHGMAYAVAGLVRDFRPSGYPADKPLVPHGMAVIVNAPSVFRFTAQVSPERHLEGAQLLGADTQGADANDAGEVLANEIIRIMRAVGMPNGLSGVGYTDDDVAALAEGAYPQQRLLQNAPRAMSKPVLADLFRQAMRYW